MNLSCVDDAIVIWRRLLMKITGISNDMILNGESIRGPELVTVRNGQKVPIGYDEDCIVFYCDPIDEISVVDDEGWDVNETAQSFELHLIVYGNQTKKTSQSIKSNIYSEGSLDYLRKNGIGLLGIPSIENGSNFMVGQTYVLRNDIRIRFDCVLEDSKAFPKVPIEEVKIDNRR